MTFQLAHMWSKWLKLFLYIELTINQNSKEKFGYWDSARLKEVVSLVSVCSSRMWSTSASWSAATSSTVASTAARTLVTVETVSPAGSPVSPAAIFCCPTTLYLWAKSQKYHIVILPLSFFSLCGIMFGINVPWCCHTAHILCGVAIPSVCRFRRADVSLRAHCLVPTHRLWHEATRVQKHVYKKTRVRPPRWD